MPIKTRSSSIDEKTQLLSLMSSDKMRDRINVIGVAYQ